MTTVQSLQDELERLHQHELVGETLRVAASGLAARCHAVQGAERIELNALLLVAWAYRSDGDYGRAEQALARAIRKALARQDVGVIPVARIARADMAAEQGRHSVAVDALVNLVNEEKEFRLLSDHNQSRAFTLLAELALDVDPGDAAQHALELGAQFWLTKSKPWPWVHALRRAHVELTRHVWCQEQFSGLVHVRNLEPNRKKHYLEAACQLIGGIDLDQVAADRPDSAGSMRLTREFFQCVAASDLTGLRSSATALLTYEMRFPHRSGLGLYVAAASLVALGDARSARAIVEFGSSLQMQPPARSAWWIHLRSELAAQQGDASEALTLYKRYVKAASAAMALQRMDMRLLIERLRRVSPAHQERISQAQPAYLDRALNFIDSNCNTASVEIAARHAGVSTTALRNAFTLYLGRQPKEYIIERRLQAARESLMRGVRPDVTIADVAQACGFSHVARFSKLYQQKFREKPSTTRRSPTVEV